MSSGAAQWGQFLAVQAKVKQLEALGLLTITPAGLALIDDVDASAQLTTLGVSAFIKTLLDDADASTALSTLGVSTFIKTLLDDADAATARATLGLGTAATKELTDWVSYTPTYTGLGTGVATTIARSRKVGDSLEIDIKLGTVTPTAVEARITLGFNGTNANISSSSTKVPSIMQAGPPVIRTVAGAVMLFPLIESNVGYLTFGIQDAGNAGLTKQLGNAAFAASNTYNIRASVPI